jgi:hypothetical protein
MTCNAVLTEAASFCPDPVAMLKLVPRGDLIVDPDFSLASEASHLVALASKYADRPMDLADACLVRISELHSRCRIWTVNRNNFSTYRRMGRRTIPCEFPPEA